MTKKLFLIFMLIMLILCGCENQNTQNAERITVQCETTVHPIDFNANIRYTGYDSDDENKITVIKSYDELENYQYLYTNDFFKENYLVIVTMIESSGSVMHEVESVNSDGEIVITRITQPICTCDMAEWNIIVELSNDIKISDFYATYNTKSRMEWLGITTRENIEKPDFDPNAVREKVDADISWVKTVEKNENTDSKRYKEIAVISSKDELKEYYDYFEEYFMFSSPNLNGINFDEAMNVYTDEFFDEKFLIMIILSSKNLPNKNREVIVFDDGSIIMNFYTPEFMLNYYYEPYWHVMIDINKSDKAEQYYCYYRHYQIDG